MDFIKTLEEELGKEAIKEYLPMQPGDVYRAYADIEDLEADFDYRPATEIEEGLGKFAAWEKAVSYTHLLSLMMALASCCVLEKEEVQLKRGIVVIGVLYAAFSAIIADGRIVSKERLLIQYLIALGGIMLSIIFLKSKNRNRKFYRNYK